jgi:hypothetical protein
MGMVLLLSLGGVCATWNYAQGAPNPINETLKINVFPWSGSEVLPEDDEIGENHRTLIDTIINGPGIGLNTSNSYLNQQIKKRRDGSLLVPKRDTLGSMAVTQGDELYELFGLTTSNLDFLIHFISDTEYYLFTTGVDLGEKGSYSIFGSTPGSPTTPIGQYIFPIYRTLVQKIDGRWAAIETLEGSAKSAWYEESSRDSDRTQIPSFDPDTWTSGDQR